MGRVSIPFRLNNLQEIIVVGYPRSGNTLLSRLLGSVLDCPVTGLYNARPLCEEGLHRPGPFVVRQLHLHPCHAPSCDNGLIPDAVTFCTHAERGDVKVVFVVRDPRDVAASVMHYWNMPSIESAVDAMLEGKMPLFTHGAWHAFVDDWLSKVGHLDVLTRFDSLLEDGVAELGNILEHLNIQTSNRDLNRAVEEQSFDATFSRILHGDGYNYGREIQLHHLWQGKNGTWRAYFTRELAERVHEHWWPYLRGYRWEENPRWFETCP